MRGGFRGTRGGDDRVGGGRGSRGEAREGKVELHEAVGEGRRKKGMASRTKLVRGSQEVWG